MPIAPMQVIQGASAAQLLTNLITLTPQTLRSIITDVALRAHQDIKAGLGIGHKLEKLGTGVGYIAGSALLVGAAGYQATNYLLGDQASATSLIIYGSTASVGTAYVASKALQLYSNPIRALNDARNEAVDNIRRTLGCAALGGLAICAAASKIWTFATKNYEREEVAFEAKKVQWHNVNKVPSLSVSFKGVAALLAAKYQAGLKSPAAMYQLKKEVAQIRANWSLIEKAFKMVEIAPNEMSLILANLDETMRIIEAFKQNVIPAHSDKDNASNVELMGVLPAEAFANNCLTDEVISHLATAQNNVLGRAHDIQKWVNSTTTGLVTGLATAAGAALLTFGTAVTGKSYYTGHSIMQDATNDVTVPAATALTVAVPAGAYQGLKAGQRTFQDYVKERKERGETVAYNSEQATEKTRAVFDGMAAQLGKQLASSQHSEKALGQLKSKAEGLKEKVTVMKKELAKQTHLKDPASLTVALEQTLDKIHSAKVESILPKFTFGSAHQPRREAAAAAA